MDQTLLGTYTDAAEYVHNIIILHYGRNINNDDNNNNVQTAADGSSLVCARARLHKRRVSCHEIMVILCVENPTTTTASAYRYIYI